MMRKRITKVSKLALILNLAKCWRMQKSHHSRKNLKRNVFLKFPLSTINIPKADDFYSNEHASARRQAPRPRERTVARDWGERAQATICLR